jgi:hypothetical protein
MNMRKLVCLLPIWVLCIASLAQAADIKSKYGSPATITCTLASLTTTSARSCLAVDNTSNLYLDVLVQVQIKSGAASTSTTGYVNIYAYGTADGGTTYAEGAGTDAAITLTVPPNVKLIGRLNVVANAVTYKSEPFSVAAAFGGVLPQKWGIIVENQSGGTLDSTEGSHLKLYQGVLAQSP